MLVRSNFNHVYSMKLVLTTVTQIDVADQASPDTPPILFHVSKGLITIMHLLPQKVTKLAPDSSILRTLHSGVTEAIKSVREVTFLHPLLSYCFCFHLV